MTHLRDPCTRSRDKEKKTMQAAENLLTLVKEKGKEKPLHQKRRK